MQLYRKKVFGFHLILPCYYNAFGMIKYICKTPCEGLQIFLSNIKWHYVEMSDLSAKNHNMYCPIH